MFVKRINLKTPFTYRKFHYQRVTWAVLYFQKFRDSYVNWNNVTQGIRNLSISHYLPCAAKTVDGILNNVQHVS